MLMPTIHTSTMVATMKARSMEDSIKMSTIMTNITTRTRQLLASSHTTDRADILPRASIVEIPRRILKHSATSL